MKQAQSLRKGKNMKTSTITHKLIDLFNLETAVHMICEAGFDCIDHTLFSGVDGKLYIEEDDYLEKLKPMKAIANSYGVSFNQTHAPYTSFKEGDDKYNKWVKPLIIKAIEATGILGAKYIVIHPFFVSTNKKQANMEFFQSLIPYAKKYNVKIAIENMFGRDPEKGILVKNVCSDAKELCDFVDSLDSEYIVACLDVGHCGIIGESVPNMIKELGKERLQCVHIHDNDGISDSHQLPYTQKINFDEIMKALSEIGYEGELTLEVGRFCNDFPSELSGDVLLLMSKVARHLADMY